MDKRTTAPEIRGERKNVPHLNAQRVRVETIALATVAALLLPSTSLAQYITRTDRHDWMLTVNLRVKAYQEERPVRYRMPEIDSFNFDQLSVVFPVIRETASSVMPEQSPESEIQFNDRTIANTFLGVKDGYQAGTRLGVWGLKGMTGRELELEVKLPVTAWETEFNDEAAMKATWPDSWPPEAASTFEPQLFVDVGPSGEPYDMEPIKNLVDKWTNGGKHKDMAPLIGAKVLAKELVSHVRSLSGFGVANNRALEIEGLELRGTPVIAKTRRGNEFELVAYAAAVFRTAGYPTRTVIGWDDGNEDSTFLEKKRNARQLRTWVEIALYNPDRSRHEWIPVDVVQIWKKEKSKLRGNYWTEPINYFGTNDELDDVMPFAFQYHPPTSVRSYGSPGFWGWMGIPDTPLRAQQGLRFVAITQSKRAGDNDRDRGG